MVVPANPAGEHAAPLGLRLAMELAGATGRRTETRELRDVERRHLEETRPGPIARGHQDRAELLLQRQEIPDEGHGLYGQARAVHVWVRNDVEQAEGVGHGQRDAARVRHLRGLLEVAAVTLEGLE